MLLMPTGLDVDWKSLPGRWLENTLLVFTSTVLYYMGADHLACTKRVNMGRNDRSRSSKCCIALVVIDIKEGWPRIPNT